MKKLKSSSLAKAVAVVLTLVCGVAALVSGISVICLYEWGAYDGEPSFYDTSLAGSQVYRDADDIFYSLYGFINSKMTEQEITDAIEEHWGEEKTNLVFALYDSASPDTALYSNYTAAKTNGEVVLDYSISGEGGEYADAAHSLTGSPDYTLRCALRDPLEADDKYLAAQGVFEWAVFLKYELIIVCAASLALTVALFIFCLSAAGHKKDSQAIEGGFFTKWPLDILLLLSGLCIGLLVSIPAWGGGFGIKRADLLIYFFALLAAGLIALLTLMDFAARVKLGRWWENSLIYKALRIVWRLCRGAFNILKDSVGAIPLSWRTALVSSAALLAVIFLEYYSTAMNSGFAFLILALVCLAIVGFLCRAAAGFRQIAQAAERIAGGDFENKLETDKLPRDMKKLAQSLNNLGEGMNAAVEQRTKSERLKAELITNVSHDIKTPLTSIINYTDLLKGEKLPKKAAEYVEVLDRQSARLKKLTDDLVEASKASTGNLAVNLESADLAELARQAAGEYAERLEKSGLTPVITESEGGVCALADGRLLWRIFDNLLSNACKYSQENTRIYIDLSRDGDKARATFKNVSKSELNINADELMERFVRGDSSRAGEGSGLGLNIAKSLAELQHGTLHLDIDGDLFKATLELPAAEKAVAAVETQADA